MEYSRKRLRLLADEWHSDYPSFAYTSLLNKRRSPFYFRVLGNEDADSIALNVISAYPASGDTLMKDVNQYGECLALCVIEALK